MIFPCDNRIHITAGIGRKDSARRIVNIDQPIGDRSTGKIQIKLIFKAIDVIQARTFRSRPLSENRCTITVKGRCEKFRYW